MLQLATFMNTLLQQVSTPANSSSGKISESSEAEELLSVEDIALEELHSSSSKVSSVYEIAKGKNIDTTVTLEIIEASRKGESSS